MHFQSGGPRPASPDRGRDAHYSAPPHRSVRAQFGHTACMGVFLSRVRHVIFVVLRRFILLFDPRREHSSVPTEYYRRRRAQRRSRTALVQRRRRLVLDQREHGGRLPVIGWLPRDDPRGACHWPRAIAREPRSAPPTRGAGFPSNTSAKRSPLRSNARAHSQSGAAGAGIQAQRASGGGRCSEQRRARHAVGGGCDAGEVSAEAAGGDDAIWSDTLYGLRRNGPSGGGEASAPETRLRAAARLRERSRSRFGLLHLLNVLLRTLLVLRKLSAELAYHL
jgi:hypothetical protein